MRQLQGTIERRHEDRLMEVIERFDGRAFPTTLGLARQWATGRYRRRSSSLETVYCAELVAATYQHMGLLPERGRPAGTTRAASGAATGSSSSRRSRSPGEVAVAVGT